MPMTEEEMLVEVALLTETIQPLFPPMVKVGLTIFIARIRKISALVKLGSDKNKLRQLIDSGALSKDIIDKIPFIAAGWFTHIKDGSLKVTPFMLFKIWKETYKGCIKLSNGSIIVSCSAATIGIILSLCPWYNRRNEFIVLTQVFIKFAHTSITELKDTIDLINLSDLMSE